MSEKMSTTTNDIRTNQLWPLSQQTSQSCCRWWQLQAGFVAPYENENHMLCICRLHSPFELAPRITHSIFSFLLTTIFGKESTALLNHLIFFLFVRLYSTILLSPIRIGCPSFDFDNSMRHCISKFVKWHPPLRNFSSVSSFNQWLMICSFQFY